MELVRDCWAMFGMLCDDDYRNALLSFNHDVLDDIISKGETS